MKLKNLFRTIAFTLVLTITIQLVPAYAVEELRQALTTESQVAETLDEMPMLPDNLAEPTAEPEPVIIEEVISKREENVKHYLMSDGSYMAAQYEYPVHYMKDGQWVDIDNTLVETEEGYKNKENDFQVSFSKDVLGNKLVEVTKDKYSVQWMYLPSLGTSLFDVEAKIQELLTEAENIGEIDGLEALDKLKSVLSYENIESDMDISYTLGSSYLKEDIVIYKKKLQYSFRMLIGTENVEPVVAEDGRISFVTKDTQEEIFNIPRPYMYDAEGVSSDEVNYELQETYGGYLLTINADKDWINAEERVFPVTVDPMIHKTLDRQSIKDVMISSKSPYCDNTTLNDRGAIYIGHDDDYLKTRGMVHFEIPASIPKDANITWASLAMYQSFYTSWTDDQAPIQIDVYEADKDWVNDTSLQKWNGYYPSGSSTTPATKPFDYILCGNIPETISGNTVTIEAQLIQIDITKQAQKWLRNSSDNKGIMLVYNKEDQVTNPSSSTCNKAMVMLISPDSETAPSGAYPQVLINYIDTTGLNDFNSYKSYSLDNSGTIYLNEATGMISYIQNVYSATGSRTTASFNQVFNVSWAGQSSVYGNGFDLNVREYMGAVDSTSDIYKQGYKYVYKDEDGTEIYFQETKDGKLVDEVGRGLILTVSGSVYTITDKDGNKRIFSFKNDGNGYTYLTSIRTNENTDSSDAADLTISYDSSNPDRIAKVTDSAGRVNNFYYDSNGKLSYITKHDGNKACDFTYTGNLLTKIHNYETGGSTSFTYDESQRISMVTNGPAKVYLAYGAGTDCRLTSLAERSTSNILFTVSYETGKTTFIHQGPSYDVDADDAIREVCIFNAYGQKITNYLTNRDGTEILGVVNDTYTETKLGDAAASADLKKNNKLVSSGVTYENVNYVNNPSFDWSIGHWYVYNPGSAACTATADESVFYLGRKSLHLDATATLTEEVACFQDIYNLTPGTYTVSAYVKTETVTGSGFFIDGQLRTTDICINTEDSQILSGTTDTDINNGWTRISYTFTMTEAYTYLRLRLIMPKGISGDVYVDAIQLQKGEGAGIYNIFNNSGFENGYGWLVDGTGAAGTFSTAESFTDNSSYIITGEVDKSKANYQAVYILDNKYSTYTLSGWAKAESGKGTKNYLYRNAKTSKTPLFRMIVGCYYTDGSVKWFDGVDFDKYTTDWQYGTTTFCVAQENKTPEYLAVKCEYAYNINTAYFDNVQLIPDTYVKSEYDDEGNLKKSENEKGETVTVEYGKDNVVTEIKDKNGVSSIYAYDSEKPHRLISVTDYKTNTYNQYDQYGNVVQSVVTENKLADYGIYYITAKTYKHSEDGHNSQLALNYSTDTANLITAKQNRKGDQQFRVVPEDDGYYSIMTVYPVCKTITYTSTGITMAAYAGDDTQQWKFEKDADGAYRIIPKSDETKCITVSQSNGAQAYLTALSSKDEGSYFKLQMLTIDESLENCGYTVEFTDTARPNAAVEDGKTYFFSIRPQNIFLNVADVAVGGGVTATTFTGQQSQRFKVYATDTENAYMIGPAENENLVFGVTEMGTTKQYITLQEKTGAETQLWVFENQGGRYFIHQPGYRTACRFFYDADDGYKIKLLGIPSQFVIIPVDGTDDALQMGATSTYTDSGMYVESVTDERGNVTTYDYNESTGKLDSYTDVKGNTYNYTYGDDNSSQSVYLDSDKDGVKDTEETGVEYKLSQNHISNLLTPSTQYCFSYSRLGEMLACGTDTRALVTYAYGNAGYGNRIRMSYGNGDTVSYTYDELGRVSKVTYTQDGVSHYYEYKYDNRSNVCEVYDSATGITVETVSDARGEVYGVTSSDGKQYYTNKDNKDKITSVVYKWNKSSYKYSYTYKTTVGEQDEIDYVILPDGTKCSNEQDGFKRITEKTVETGEEVLKSAYSYLDGVDNYTTNLVESMTMLNGDTLHYTYDVAGNITSITKNDETEPFATYEYDSLNQLTRENRKDLNKTWVMTYDNAGNILSKNEYVYTTGTPNEPVATMAPAYSTGDWKDLMTGLDGGTITYDAIGNPLTYYNGMSFTWQDGRKLSHVVIDEYKTIDLEYDEDGLLHKKIFVDTQNVTEETTYFYSSGVLQGLRETLYYEGNAEEYYDIWFLYDETGEIIGFDYFGKTYYYSKNLQGDVLAILDGSGTVVGTYTYDAWGRVIKVTDGNGNEFTNEDAGVLAIRNPIRYRGYYYDRNLDMYYLNSRYYDPYSGRFLNADRLLAAPGSENAIIGSNLFTYCNNNPVNSLDNTGEAAITISTCILIVSIVAGVISAGYTATTSYKYTGEVDWGNTILSGISAFSFFYTYGMSAYGWYLSYCDYRGYTPVTTIGSTNNYPPNNGFNSTPQETTLQPGSVIQRSGGEKGVYVAPANTPVQKLSVPPDKINAPITYYKVVQPLPVQSGTAMPWYGQPGGGTQYVLPDSIKNLRCGGYLEIFDK